MTRLSDRDGTSGAAASVAAAVDLLDIRSIEALPNAVEIRAICRSNEGNLSLSLYEYTRAFIYVYVPSLPLFKRAASAG